MKRELKAKISNFVGLFLFPVSCEKITFEVEAFPAFSLRAQKLNQQPAVTYDMENRDLVIKRNKVITSAAVNMFIVVLLFLRGLNIHDKTLLPYGALSHVFPISYVISCKMTADSSFLCRNADGPKSPLVGSLNWYFYKILESESMRKCGYLWVLLRPNILSPSFCMSEVHIWKKR